MAKREWRSIAADDEAILVEGSRSRRRLLELASRGPEGRRRAVLLDPGLAAADGSEGDFGDDDVAEVKAAILRARRLRRVESSTQQASHRLSGLAAALALFLLFLLPAEVERSNDLLRSPRLRASAGEAVMTHSAVEAIDLPGARVYELADEDFSVILIVDESFEL